MIFVLSFMNTENPSKNTQGNKASDEDYDFELKELRTPSPINQIKKKTNINSIPMKEDTPFLKETELEEFHLVGQS